MPALNHAHLDHRRIWRGFDYCYPVISRRAGGLSLGVNLNPGKKCNFDCVYCEVDRKTPPGRTDVDLGQMEAEMASLLDLAASGGIFGVYPFIAAGPEQQRLKDIAFSGDGEPTTAGEFAQAAKMLAALLGRRGLADVKMVLITNASRLRESAVAEGIDAAMAHNGEIWAKLDAGTDEHYRAVNRTDIPFEETLGNIEHAGKRWPLKIQSLFLEWMGRGPSGQELDAYLCRLRRLLERGARIVGIQCYTIARPTPDAGAKPLAGAALDAIADRMASELPDVPTEVFHGPVE